MAENVLISFDIVKKDVEVYLKEYYNNLMEAGNIKIENAQIDRDRAINSMNNRIKELNDQIKDAERKIDYLKNEILGCENNIETAEQAYRQVLLFHQAFCEGIDAMFDGYNNLNIEDILKSYVENRKKEEDLKV